MTKSTTPSSHTTMTSMPPTNSHTNIPHNIPPNMTPTNNPNPLSYHTPAHPRLATRANPSPYGGPDPDGDEWDDMSDCDEDDEDDDTPEDDDDDEEDDDEEGYYIVDEGSIRHKQPQRPDAGHHHTNDHNEAGDGNRDGGDKDKGKEKGEKGEDEEDNDWVTEGYAVYDEDLDGEGVAVEHTDVNEDEDEDWSYDGDDEDEGAGDDNNGNDNDSNEVFWDAGEWDFGGDGEDGMDVDVDAETGGVLVGGWDAQALEEPEVGVDRGIGVHQGVHHDEVVHHGLGGGPNSRDNDGLADLAAIFGQGPADELLTLIRAGQNGVSNLGRNPNHNRVNDNFIDYIYTHHVPFLLPPSASQLPSNQPAHPFPRYPDSFSQPPPSTQHQRILPEGPIPRTSTARLFIPSTVNPLLLAFRLRRDRNGNGTRSGQRNRNGNTSGTHRGRTPFHNFFHLPTTSPLRRAAPSFLSNPHVRPTTSGPGFSPPPAGAFPNLFFELSDVLTSFEHQRRQEQQQGEVVEHPAIPIVPVVHYRDGYPSPPHEPSRPLSTLTATGQDRADESPWHRLMVELFGACERRGCTWCEGQFAGGS
ncbi:hypothetical protein B0J18DRAFT_430026, partial [Chaetomium sp. MPI-SDFR-AT-0129]